MSKTGEEQMWLRWLYLPPFAIGEPASVPRHRKCVVTSLRHAMKVGNVLKETHGNDLISVDVTIRLISS